MSKILIVYYSLFQNTKNFALEIARQTGGDIRELISEKNYSFNYNTAAKEVRSEIARGFCPKLLSGNEPIDNYDTIFIGTPNWFKTMAPPVRSFIRNHNFEGKTIIPFSTSGGGGLGEIQDDIAKECLKAKILPGIDVSGQIVREDIEKWLKRILNE